MSKTGEPPGTKLPENEAEVRVFVIDSSPIFRAGVRATLERFDGLVVSGEAATLEEAHDRLRPPQSAVDVILAQFDQEIRGVLASAKDLMHDFRLSSRTERILMVCTDISDDAIAAALRAGASGLLTRDSPPGQLCRAIQIVADDGAVFSPSLAVRLRACFGKIGPDEARTVAFPGLTDRQRQILALLAQGHDNRRIARTLGLSEKTVRNHVSHIFSRLNVASRAEAVARAHAAGMLAITHL